jgi:hypothetical protein
MTINDKRLEYAFIVLMIFSVFFSAEAYAFSKLTNGFKTITSTYLIPLAHAVAGASFILFVTLSLFKQEEYQKKAATVVVLSVFIGGGLEVISKVIQSFS